MLVCGNVFMREMWLVRAGFWRLFFSMSSSALWSVLLCVCFIVSSPKALSAQSDKPLSYDEAAELIMAARTDSVDYLKHHEDIERAFTLIKETHTNRELTFQAAAVYAELLFRQEKYDAQKEHVNSYLARMTPESNLAIYLLLLESKIKYLSQEKQQEEAGDVVRELENMLNRLDVDDQITVYRAFAYYYTAFDWIEKTLQYAVAGLELSEQQNSSSDSGFFLQKISDVHSFTENVVAAISYAQRAVKEYEKTQDEHLTSKSYWSLGNVYLKHKNVEKGLFYFKKALAYFKSVGMQKGIVFAQYSIADIEFSLGNYESSLTVLKDNIRRAEDAGISDMQLASMILKSKIYESQELWDEANNVSDSILPLINTFSRAHYKAMYFMQRYRLKKHTGRIDEAFDAVEQYITYSEKHLKATNNDGIKTLQSKLELKQKEAEINRLGHENFIRELQTKEQYQAKIIWRLSAAMFIFLFVFFVFLFYWQLKKYRKYHAISLRDDLTKAPNRRSILAISKEALEINNVTIAIVDLDYFKRVNDNFGHDVGDEVLIMFADAVRFSLREGDQFGRYGGEEWLLIIKSVEEPGIRQVFERLKNTFQRLCKEQNLGQLLKDWEPTFSAGAVRCMEADNNLNDIIKRADELLYKAKNNGRDQVIIV